MGSLSRLIDRNKEKEELENIRKVYGKKPKYKCPKCHKKTLFMTNKEKEVFCIRCDRLISKKNK